MWGLKRNLLKAYKPSPPEAARSPKAEAWTLAQGGRFREAIDRIDTEALENIELDLLRESVTWRGAAFEPETAAPNWPPNLPDPFPGAASPPEVERRELTAEILGGAIQHHGCVLVRGLIDPDETNRLAAMVEQAVDAAVIYRAGLPDNAEPTRWYAPYPLKPEDGMKELGRAMLTDNGSVWMADSPAAVTEFTRLLKAHGLTGVIEDYLGEKAYLSVGKATLIRARPTPDIKGWHQDGVFLGPEIRTVNCWLALSDCGETAPGLDIYPRRVNQLVETGTRGAGFWWVVGDGVVDDLAVETPIKTPSFKAGDALLFDQMFLHRTGGRPGMTQNRLAIESWFFAGSSFPMRQMPIAI